MQLQQSLKSEANGAICYLAFLKGKTTFGIQSEVVGNNSSAGVLDWSFLLKLAKNQPSWTIQAQPGSAIGPFHWSNRKLTPQEMGRTQTFPELIFDCGRTDIQKMIGNAVPSLVTEVLAREIRSQLLGEKP